MSALVDTIMKSFDKLPTQEQREVASRILQRATGFDLPPVSDDELTHAADAVFQHLDEAEADDADSR